VTVVEVEAVPLVPGVTHGLTAVPGAAPGVVVTFGVGEAVAGVGEAVCGTGEAVCGVGVAVLPGDCVLGDVVLGEVVTAGPGFALGVVVLPGFCPAVVPEGLLLDPAVCPEGVAACATSVKPCMEAVGPVFKDPQ